MNDFKSPTPVLLSTFPLNQNHPSTPYPLIALRPGNGPPPVEHEAPTIEV